MIGLTVMVLVPLPPCVMVKLFGEADSEKFGAGPAMLTLLNVAVFSPVLLWSVTANPAVALVFIVTFVLAICVHVEPSAE